MVDPPTSKRQQQAAATRQQLLAAARAEFEEKGYQAATVAAIGRRARTAHGTFYLHFRNKDDVFVQVMAEVTDRLYQESGARWRGDPAAGVHAAVRSLLEVFALAPQLWRCLLEAALADPSVQALWLAFRRRFTDRVVHAVEAQQAAGLVRPVDAALAAHALGSMVEWAGFTHLVLGVPAEGGIDQLAATLTDLWVHALYVAPEGAGA